MDVPETAGGVGCKRAPGGRKDSVARKREASREGFQSRRGAGRRDRNRRSKKPEGSPPGFVVPEFQTSSARGLILRALATIASLSASVLAAASFSRNFFSLTRRVRRRASSRLRSIRPMFEQCSSGFFVVERGEGTRFWPLRQIPAASVAAEVCVSRMSVGNVGR